MSLSVSAASPSSAYAAPSLTPTIDDILAQNAAADAQVAGPAVAAADPTQPAPPSDPALGNNLDISV